MRTVRTFVILGMALLLTAAATWSDACALSCSFMRASTACHAPAIASAPASTAQISDRCMHHDTAHSAASGLPASTAMPIAQHPCQHDIVSSEPEAFSSRVHFNTALFDSMSPLPGADSIRIPSHSPQTVQPSHPAGFDPLIRSLRI